MSFTAPVVTIGMPVRNGGQALAEALESIAAQTFTDFELVIADNASTDATAEICRAYAKRDARIRYHRHERNIGAAANFNFTFVQCRSEYFKWAAHDDLLAPTYLARCLAQFDAGPANLVLAYPRRRLMTAAGELLASDHHEWASRWRQRGGPRFLELIGLYADVFPTFAFGLMRASVLRKTQLVRAYPAADLVLVTQLRLFGPFSEVPEELYFQRRHALDAEWRARASRRGEAAWYDPVNPHLPTFPRWRLFLHHLQAVHHAPVSWPRKAWGYTALGAYFPVKVSRLVRCGKLWRRISEELRSSSDAPFYETAVESAPTSVQRDRVPTRAKPARRVTADSST